MSEIMGTFSHEHSTSPSEHAVYKNRSRVTVTKMHEKRVRSRKEIEMTPF